MTAIFISLAVGVLTFCFGMLGHYLHRLLPERHMSTGSKEMIGGIIGLVSLLLTGAAVRRAQLAAGAALATSTTSWSDWPLSSATPAIRPSLMQTPHMETRFQKLDRQGCGEPGHP